MYQQSQAWGTSPAEIIGIEDLWVAWDFNGAVYDLGTYVMNEFDDRKNFSKDGKRRRSIKEILTTIQNGGRSRGGILSLAMAMLDAGHDTVDL